MPRQSGAKEEEILVKKALGLNTGGFAKAANSAKDLPYSHLRTDGEYFIGEPELSQISDGRRREEKHSLQVSL